MEQFDLFDGHGSKQQPDQHLDVERSLLADLLASSRLYHTSQDYLDLLDFVSRLRNFAPFNAMLLQIQKPGLMYAASAYDWKTRFSRTIKEGARPLLILWPFSPVALVYDVEDTEGTELPADVAQTFQATGQVTTQTITETVQRLARLGIDLKCIPYGDGNAGCVKAIRRSDDAKVKPEYQIRLNANHEPNIQFVTLVHELGHLYLGHLGPDKYLKIAQRPPPPDHAKELEAESLAYLVCKRHRVGSKSESYLANHLQPDTILEHLNLDVMLKAAGQVEMVLDIAAHTRFEPKDSR
jgi:hypothetical protein